MKHDDDEDDLFGFEWYHARKDDPDTSHSAAGDAKWRAAKTKLKILNALWAHGPQTCDGLRQIIGIDCHQRASDLRKLDKMIDDTGSRKLSDRGSTSMVLAINLKGIEKLEGQN